MSDTCVLDLDSCDVSGSDYATLLEVAEEIPADLLKKIFVSGCRIELADGVLTISPKSST